MPKGVTKQKKKEKPKSQAENSNNITHSTEKIKGNKENIQQQAESEVTLSSDQLLDTPSINDNLNDKSDVSTIDESDFDEKQSSRDPKSDLNFFIEDVRGAIKENTLSDSSSQVLPGSSNQKFKKLPKFLQIIDNWLYGKIRNPFTPYQHVIGSPKRKRSPIRIIILLILLASFGYVLVFASKNLSKLAPIAVPTFTPVPTYSIPTPFSVEFPGGWIFLLGTSEKAFPDWKPSQAEWFKDTTICKLIAIPWTKQIDAVYKTLEPGEKFILTMSNKDEAVYQIETLETSLVESIMKKLNRNSPCMVIFLFRENTLTAQVIISSPPLP